MDAERTQEIEFVDLIPIAFRAWRTDDGLIVIEIVDTPLRAAGETVDQAAAGLIDLVRAFSKRLEHAAVGLLRIKSFRTGLEEMADR